MTVDERPAVEFGGFRTTDLPNELLPNKVPNIQTIRGLSERKTDEDAGGRSLLENDDEDASSLGNGGVGTLNARRNCTSKSNEMSLQTN